GGGRWTTAPQRPARGLTVPHSSVKMSETGTGGRPPRREAFSQRGVPHAETLFSVGRRIMWFIRSLRLPFRRQAAARPSSAGGRRALPRVEALEARDLLSGFFGGPFLPARDPFTRPHASTAPFPPRPAPPPFH